MLVGGAAELNVHLLQRMQQADSHKKIPTNSHMYVLNKKSHFISFDQTFPLLSMADAVWTVSPCRP